MQAPGLGHDTVQAIATSPLCCRLAEVSVEVAVLAAAVWLLIRVARIRSARLCSLLWVLVLAKGLLGLAFGSPFELVGLHVASLAISEEARVTRDAASPSLRPRTVAIARAADGVREVRPDDASGVPSAPSTPSSAAITALRQAADFLRPESLARHTAAILMAAWLAGLAWALARTVADFRRIRQLHSAAAAPAQGLLAVFQSEAARIGVTRPPTLRVCDRIESPALAGFLRPVVLVPRWLAESSAPADLRWILAHELMHYRQKDTAALLVRRAALVALWFHPAVRWAGRRWEEAMERACDRALIAGEGDARLYAEQLHGVLEGLAARRKRRIIPVATGLFATRTQIGRRIQALLTDSLAMPARLSASSATLLVLGALAAFSFGMGIHRSAPAQEPVGIATPQPAVAGPAATKKADAAAPTSTDQERKSPDKLKRPLTIGTADSIPLVTFLNRLGPSSGLSFLVSAGEEAMIDCSFVNKTTEEILNALLPRIGLKWERVNGDTIQITADLKNRVFHLTPEDTARVKVLLEHKVLQNSVYGWETKPLKIAQLVLDEGESTLMMADSQVHIDNLDSFLNSLKTGDAAELTTRIYTIHEKDGPEIKALIEAVVRSRKTAFDSRRGVWLAGKNLAVRDTAENLAKIEELLNDRLLIRGGSGTLQVQVFDLQPTPALRADAAQAAAFFESTQEVIETFLYAEEGKAKAAEQGRRMWPDPDNFQITITDFPDRLRRVADYLGSLRQIEHPLRQEVIALQHIGSDAMAEKLRPLLRSTDAATSGPPAPAPAPEIASLPSSNSLIVRYSETADLTTIKDLIKTLDVPQPPGALLGRTLVDLGAMGGARPAPSAAPRAEKSGASAEIVTKAYSIGAADGLQLRATVEAVARSLPAPAGADRSVSLAGKNLVIRDTPDNMARLEKLLQEHNAQAAAPGKIRTQEFDVTPVAALVNAPGQAADFFASTVEVINTFLYAEFGRAKSVAEGRTLVADAAHFRITVTDTPDRLGRVADYLGSLRQIEQPWRREVIPIRYMPSDDLVPTLRTAVGAHDTSPPSPAQANVDSPTPEIVSLPSDNAIVVRYKDPADLAHIKATVSRLDVRPSPSDLLAKTRRDLDAMAAAMESYHADHGAYPESLIFLMAPRGSLSAWPLDFYAPGSHPGSYRVNYDTPDRHPVLYSVGPDGVDQKGLQEYVPESGKKGPGDIVKRLQAESAPPPRQDIEVETVTVDLTSQTTPAVRREVAAYLTSGTAVRGLNEFPEAAPTRANGAPVLLGALQDAKLAAWEDGRQIVLKYGPHFTLANRHRSTVSFDTGTPLALDMLVDLNTRTEACVWTLKAGPSRETVSAAEAVTLRQKDSMSYVPIVTKRPAAGESPTSYLLVRGRLIE